MNIFSIRNRSNPLALSLVLACFFSFFSWNSPARAQQDDLNVYIRAQEATHGPKAHNYPAFLKKWTNLLDDRGITVDGSLDFPDPDRLSEADVLVFYCQNSIQNDRQKKLLERFMDRGGDLVFLHSAVTSSYPSWLKNRIGGAWDDSKWSVNKKQGMYFKNRSHPIVSGVGNFFLPNDEVYWDLKLHDDIHTLAESFHDIRIIAPQMWTFRKGDSRSFTWLAGHRHTSFNLPHGRALVLRGLAWAAGLDVNKFLTEEEKASLPYPEGGPVQPEKAADTFDLHPEFDASLVAAEPKVVNPIDLFFDGSGRLWVAETPEYPQVRDPDNPRDRISVYEDTNNDGRMDKKKVFYEGLKLVTSILPYRDGVLATAAPDVFWLRDTDGDGEAEKKERILTGFGTNDTHAVVNHMRRGLNGWVYATLGYSQGNLKDDGTSFGKFSSGVIRFRPDGSKVQQVSSKGGNTWGLGFASDGELFWSQATSGRHLHHTVMPKWALNRGRIGDTNSFSFPLDKYIDLHPAMSTDHPAYVQVAPKGGFTAGAGCTPYTGGAWPEEHRNSVFVSEPTLWLTHRDKLKTDGVTYSATPDREKKEFMAAEDLWHLPNGHRIGPDGALYISDFYNQAVSHNDIRVGGKYHGPNNQAIRPDRDRRHGRVWRIQHENAKSFDQPRLGSATTDRLVDALGHPNQWFRMTAQRLLVEGDHSGAGAAIRKRLNSDSSSPSFRLHALWTLEQKDQLPDEFLINGIHDRSPAVRKNALQIVSNRSFIDRDISSDVRKAIVKQVDADNPQVQLDALIALGSTRIEANAARKILSVYPALENDWARSAALGALKQSPGVALSQMYETGTRPDELYEPISQAIVDLDKPGKVASFLISLSKKKGHVDTKKRMLQLITHEMEPEKAPELTDELRGGLRRLLNSENSQVVAATLPLLSRWNTGDHFGDEPDRKLKELVQSINDSSVATERRVELVEALLAMRPVPAPVVEAAVNFLNGSIPAPAKKRLIGKLASVNHSSAGTALVEVIPQLAPDLIPLALEQVLQRDALVKEFLNTLRNGKRAVLEEKLGSGRTRDLIAFLQEKTENGLAFHLTRFILSLRNATLQNTTPEEAWTSRTPEAASAEVDSSLRLNGENEFIALSDLGFSGDVSVTVASWVKVQPGAGSTNNVFGFGDAGEKNRVFSVRTRGDGGWRFYFWANDLDASTDPYFGEWTHVAAVYDASSDKRALYVNGKKVAEDAPADPDLPDRNYRIGGFNDEFFRGLLYDLRIYKRALSSSEIKKFVE